MPEPRSLGRAGPQAHSWALAPGALRGPVPMLACDCVCHALSLVGHSSLLMCLCDTWGAGRHSGLGSVGDCHSLPAAFCMLMWQHPPPESLSPL